MQERSAASQHAPLSFPLRDSWSNQRGDIHPPFQHGPNAVTVSAAGSLTANVCHLKHGGDSWPDAHGVSLLREARDEFNKLTEPLPTQKRSVVIDAAAGMGIANW